MALKDYNNTGDSSGQIMYAANWVAITFTATSSYTLTSIKLKLYKATAPGTFTASIRATSASKPTEADLCSGTYAGNSLGASPGAFIEIDMGDGCSITSGVKYAIVMRCAGSYAYARYAMANYAGGGRVKSADSGSTWGSESSLYDMMFETYSASTLPSDQVTVRRLVAVGNDKFYYEDI